MDPCAFVKILVGGLALKIPIASKPTRAGIHPSSFPCFCEFKLDGFPVQTAVVPLISVSSPDPDVQSMAASFHLDQADVQKLYKKSCFGSTKPCLEVAVYTGRQGSTCGVNLGKLLGRLSVPLELEDAHERPAVFLNGWVSIGKFRSEDSKPGPQLHLNVRAEPDPRFVFQFDGEPECSPQVFQIQGNIRQPIFSCKFSCDRNSRSRVLFLCEIRRDGWLGAAFELRKGIMAFMRSPRMASSLDLPRGSSYRVRVLLARDATGWELNVGLLVGLEANSGSPP